MKRLLLLAVALLMCSLSVIAGTYHEGDKAKLRAFLSQGINASKFGITSADMSTWETSEAWISKVSAAGWNSASPKRIISMNWTSSAIYLSGDLDLSGCTTLTHVNFCCNDVTSVNLSGCTALTDLLCIADHLTSLDLSGCTNLESLFCYSNQLTSLDVGGFTKLKYIRSEGNQLATLNVSGCTSLELLYCPQNRLTSLDASGLTELTRLDCQWNQLTSLNVNGCTKLTELSCSGLANSNKLTSLDVSSCTSLTQLNCEYNQLTSLNLSNCTELRDLQCDWNELTSLNVNSCTKLRLLNCEYNELTSLDVSSCTPLTTLSCHNNQLTTLNLSASGHAGLTTLQCHDNELTALNVTGCAALTDLTCHNNQLSSLNVSNCTSLPTLDCSGNSLTSLDVSGCTALTQLKCHDNQLTSLNISGCMALTLLSCGGNQLTSSLDVSNRTALTQLSCADNQLTSLNVSGCTKLMYLNCASNQLSSLNASGFTSLLTLSCSNNELTSLNVSGCTKLITMNCENNYLPSLDISGLTALTTMVCSNNELTSLNVTGCTKLMSLLCYYNQLSSLNVKSCSALSGLGCNYNQLSSLDVSNMRSLLSVTCDNNELTSLNVTGCTELTSLLCSSNQLSELDVSSCTKLTTILCHTNPLTYMAVGWSTPRPVNATYFPDVSGATLRVPVGKKSLYKAAAVWKDFGTILEVGEVAEANSLSVSSANTFAAAGGTQTLTVSSNVSWTVSKSPSGTSTAWLSYSPASGSSDGTITLTASANETTSPRTATIIVSGSGVTAQQITVTQSAATAPTPSLSVSATSLSFPQGGSMQPFTVTSNVAWSAAKTPTDASWLTFTPESGSTDATVNVTATPNETTSPREATIIVSGNGVESKQITITQSAGTAPTPSLSLNTSALEFSQDGSSQPVTVTANVAWTATRTPTDALWLTYTPESGTTGGTVNVTAAPNGTTSLREATITFSSTVNGVESKQITVTQLGVSSSLTVSTLTLDFPRNGSTKEITVTSNVSWSAVKFPSDASWLSYTPASGTTNGTISVTAMTNVTTSSREASITISGTGVESKQIIVTQPAGEPSLTVNTYSIACPQGGLTEPLTITSNVSWSASKSPSDASWLRFTPESGTTGSPFLVTAELNLTTSTREATITVTGSGISREIVVTQAAVVPVLEVSTDPLSYLHGGSTKQLSVSSNVSWTVSRSPSDASWLTFTPASNSSNGTIRVTAAQNIETTSPRTATLTVSGGGIVRNISVTQDGKPYLTLNTSSLPIGYSGGSEQINVNSNVAWAATRSPLDATWLSLGSESGSNDGTVTLSASSNDTRSSRVATVTVSGLGGLVQGTVNISQPASPYLDVVPLSHEYPDAGGTRSIIITSNVSWSVLRSPDDSWLTLSSESGSANSQLDLTAAVNDTGSPRSATVTVQSPDGTVHTISISQLSTPAADVSPFLTVNRNQVEIGSTSSQDIIVVEANVDWIVSHSNTWLSVAPGTGSGYGIVELIFAPNTANTARYETLTISSTDGTVTQTVNVSQAGTVIPDILYASPSSLFFNDEAGENSFYVTANIPWQAVTTAPDWISITPSSGSTDANVRVNVQPNMNPSTRTGNINITSSTGNYSVFVEQAPFQGNVLPTNVELNHKDVVLNLGQTLQLQANVNPSGATTPPLAWISSNPDVAVVANGFVAALSPGRTYITVQTTAEVSLQDQCVVTVNNTDFGSGNATVIDEQAVSVQCNGDKLTVNSPNAENVYLYSTAGKLLYVKTKQQGVENFNIEHLQKGVLIVRGASGWARKIIRQ